MGFLVRVAAAVDRLNDWIGSAIRWLTLVMVLIGAYNAVARWATRYFDVSLASNAYLDLQWYLFSLVFLMGAAYGLNQDVHVRVDVLYSRFGVRGRAWIDLFGTVLFLLPFCVLMLWVSFPAVARSWSIREASPDPGGLARYPIKTVILVSFGLLMIQGLSQLVKQVVLIRRGEPPVELQSGAAGPAAGGVGGGANTTGTDGPDAGPGDRRVHREADDDPDSRNGER